MTPTDRRKRIASSAAITAALIGAFELLIPHAGWVVGALASVLVVAWRHDNDVGAFFPLAVGFVLILLILALLMLMMAIVL
jgi:putative Mn2+ efflux pump MntP